MPTNQIPLVVIDPGHGGSAAVGGSSPNNAVGPNGLREKDLTLDLALRVQQALGDHVRVVLTRDGDVNLSLSDRAAVGRRHAAAAFVSIHFNGWHDPGVDGTVAFIAATTPTGRSRELASDLAQRTAAVTQVHNRGVRERDFGVLLASRHHPQTSAVLLEVAFLTNPQQAERLTDTGYRDDLAEAIANAIHEHVGRRAEAQAMAIEPAMAHAAVYGASAGSGIASGAGAAALVEAEAADEGLEFDDVLDFSGALAARSCEPEDLAGCGQNCPDKPASDAGSTHFELSDFHSKDGVEVPERFRGNVQQVMDNLEVLQAAVGDKEITVVSGYRSCEHNCRVGGASASRHLCGQAADIRVERMTPRQVHDTIERLIEANKMDEGGLGLYNSFVHYDVRGTRARWDFSRG